jgi:hypothetical protein
MKLETSTRSSAKSKFEKYFYLYIFSVLSFRAIGLVILNSGHMSKCAQAQIKGQDQLINSFANMPLFTEYRSHLD